MITVKEDGTVVVTVRGFAGWTFAVAPSGAVTVTPPADDRITAERWRTMPIGRILDDARSALGGEAADAFISMLAESANGLPVSPRKSPREHRQAVARVYRMALEQGLPPAATIARHWTTDESRPVSEATARGWIASIRRTPENPDGLLDSHAVERQRVGADKFPAPRVPGQLLRPISAEDLAALAELHRGQKTGRSPGSRSTATANTTTTKTENKK